MNNKYFYSCKLDAFNSCWKCKLFNNIYDASEYSRIDNNKSIIISKIVPINYFVLLLPKSIQQKYLFNKINYPICLDNNDSSSNPPIYKLPYNFNNECYYFI